MNYDDMRAWQAREQGDESPRPISFTGQDIAEAYGPYGPDDDDIEILNLVMERDMADRERYWRDRALRAEGALHAHDEGEEL